MKGLRILQPGLLTTVQDLGRWGYQGQGMVVAGAMDPVSMQIANLLVGNRREQACLEITLLGPVIEILTDTILAVTGAEFSLELNGKSVPGWSALPVQAGDILAFKEIRQGCRGYLAIRGGIEVPDFLGSKSTYLRGKIGGLEGRRLAAGDKLSIGLDHQNPIDSVSSWYFTQPSYPKTKQIRVIPGPELDRFSSKGLTTFFTQPYQISSDSDRMGYRLQGGEIEAEDGYDIISDAIAFGTIQVPANGQPMILMADRQPTGGYLRIGTVIQADLSQVAQSKPGDIFYFHREDIEEAQNLYRTQENILASLAK